MFNVRGVWCRAHHGEVLLGPSPSSGSRRAGQIQGKCITRPYKADRSYFIEAICLNCMVRGCLGKSNGREGNTHRCCQGQSSRLSEEWDWWEATWPLPSPKRISSGHSSPAPSRGMLLSMFVPVAPACHQPAPVPKDLPGNTANKLLILNIKIA